MPPLVFNGVTKDYGELRALAGLDLEAADGELLVLLGPSGSGKTTALRIAAGLEDVTGGAVAIGERDVTRLPPAQRNVSMVFQNYALFPHLTVSENIGFGLAARRVPRAEAAERVREAAAVAGCDAFLDRKPFQLSGGERQRVALARAVVREPDVFLLDEPLSNLDAQLRTQTRGELKELQQRLGATMVYVTHDQVEALTLGDRVAVLDRGVLQQVGSPADIYRRPANRFVARFVGSPAMNVLPAELDDGHLRAGPFTIELGRGTARLAAAARLELGVRPEHVRVAAADRAGSAEVRLVEMAGSESYVHVAADAHAVVARVSAESEPAPGASVRLEVSPADVFVFDAETGALLLAGRDA